MGEYYKDVLPAECLTESNYVITDSFVDSILDIDTNFIQALAAVGVSAQKILIPADQSDDSGEASVEPYKTTDVLHDCVDDILKRGISKHTCIISVGGGVVNNMCGVLASMLYRGISLVHFTTTTMGMLDAALDFKQVGPISYLLSLISYLLSLISYLLSLISYLLSLISHLLSLISYLASPHSLLFIAAYPPSNLPNSCILPSPV